VSVTDTPTVRRGLRRFAAALGCVLTTFALPATTATTSPAHAATAWTGTVFEDTQPDGKRGDAALEPGIAGVTITTTAADGASTATTTTGPDGRFTIVPVGAPPYRIEYTTIPANYVVGRRLDLANRTGQSGAEVRIVTDTSAPLDLAVVRPGQTCQQDPTVAFTCFISGHAAGVSATERTLGTAPSSRSGWYATKGYKPPAQIANHKQTGATYGVAWQPSSRSLYTSAFVKRFSGLGPGGIGAIYRNDALFIDLASVPGLAPFGTDPHPQVLTGDWFHDAATYPVVGRIGIGDIDMSIDGRTLYATNLNSRQLLAIPVGRDGSRVANLTAAPPDEAAGPGQIGQFAVPSPCDNPDEWRVFAVAPRGADVLVGGSCTVSLQVAVLSFDPGQRTWSKPLLSFGVNFPRGPQGFEASWEGWRDDETKAWNRPQLFISDISEDGDDLVLGLRDRYGDMTGKNSGTTNVGHLPVWRSWFMTLVGSCLPSLQVLCS
jgi:hypothetical protein